ncbi:hypothetical protein [Heterosigma akashiwo virus 01]|uniref:Uncharacterized protein n=1 Tax=Heterosigma akashiwo virus 01 TaxID=97195 RepID=A0A1C9C5H3_HAV01|nr:hypothetical protein D1R72_gp208 [Heterosigma akashiwo virus 01]AOM63539.1 hypothetical protein [Heterosigma akashiwo virus 01]
MADSLYSDINELFRDIDYKKKEYIRTLGQNRNIVDVKMDCDIKNAVLLFIADIHHDFYEPLQNFYKSNKINKSQQFLKDVNFIEILCICMIILSYASSKHYQDEIRVLEYYKANYGDKIKYLSSPDFDLTNIEKKNKDRVRDFCNTRTKNIFVALNMEENLTVEELVPTNRVMLSEYYKKIYNHIDKYTTSPNQQSLINRILPDSNDISLTTGQGLSNFSFYYTDIDKENIITMRFTDNNNYKNVKNAILDGMTNMYILLENEIETIFFVIKLILYNSKQQYLKVKIIPSSQKKVIMKNRKEEVQDFKNISEYVERGKIYHKCSLRISQKSLTTNVKQQINRLITQIVPIMVDTTKGSYGNFGLEEYLSAVEPPIDCDILDYLGKEIILPIEVDNVILEMLRLNIRPISSIYDPITIQFTSPMILFQNIYKDDIYLGNYIKCGIEAMESVHLDDIHKEIYKLNLNRLFDLHYKSKIKKYSLKAATTNTKKIEIVHPFLDFEFSGEEESISDETIHNLFKNVEEESDKLFYIKYIISLKNSLELLTQIIQYSPGDDSNYDTDKIYSFLGSKNIKKTIEDFYNEERTQFDTNINSNVYLDYLNHFMNLIIMQPHYKNLEKGHKTGTNILIIDNKTFSSKELFDKITNLAKFLNIDEKLLFINYDKKNIDQKSICQMLIEKVYKRIYKSVITELSSIQLYDNLFEIFNIKVNSIFNEIYDIIKMHKTNIILDKYISPPPLNFNININFSSDDDNSFKDQIKIQCKELLYNIWIFNRVLFYLNNIFSQKMFSHENDLFVQQSITFITDVGNILETTEQYIGEGPEIRVEKKTTKSPCIFKGKYNIYNYKLQDYDFINDEDNKLGYLTFEGNYHQIIEQLQNYVNVHKDQEKAFKKVFDHLADNSNELGEFVNFFNNDKQGVITREILMKDKKTICLLSNDIGYSEKTKYKVIPVSTQLIITWIDLIISRIVISNSAIKKMEDIPNQKKIPKQEIIINMKKIINDIYETMVKTNENRTYTEEVIKHSMIFINQYIEDNKEEINDVFSEKTFRHTIERDNTGFNVETINNEVKKIYKSKVNDYLLQKYINNKEQFRTIILSKNHINLNNFLVNVLKIDKIFNKPELIKIKFLGQPLFDSKDHNRNYDMHFFAGEGIKTKVTMLNDIIEKDTNVSQFLTSYHNFKTVNKNENFVNFALSNLKIHHEACKIIIAIFLSKSIGDLSKNMYSFYSRSLNISGDMLSSNIATLFYENELSRRNSSNKGILFKNNVVQPLKKIYNMFMCFQSQEHTTKGILNVPKQGSRLFLNNSQKIIDDINRKRHFLLTTYKSNEVDIPDLERLMKITKQTTTELLGQFQSIIKGIKEDESMEENKIQTKKYKKLEKGDQEKGEYNDHTQQGFQESHTTVGELMKLNRELSEESDKFDINDFEEDEEDDDTDEKMEEKLDMSGVKRSSSVSSMTDTEPKPQTKKSKKEEADMEEDDDLGVSVMEGVNRV